MDWLVYKMFLSEMSVNIALQGKVLATALKSAFVVHFGCVSCRMAEQLVGVIGCETTGRSIWQLEFALKHSPDKFVPVGVTEHVEGVLGEVRPGSFVSVKIRVENTSIQHNNGLVIFYIILLSQFLTQNLSRIMTNERHQEVFVILFIFLCVGL